MASRNTKSTLTMASAVAISLTVAPPASAQLLDIATGALGILNTVTGNSGTQAVPPQAVPPQVAPSQAVPSPVAPPQAVPPQAVAPRVAPRPIVPPVAIPRNTVQPSPEFTVGAGNLNGNTINLCLSGCMPGGSAPIAPPPQAFTSAPAAPAPQPRTPIPQTTAPSVNNVPVSTPPIAP